MRAITCSPAEIEAYGWQLLPGAEQLRTTGTSYSLPTPQDDGKVVVSLGSPEGASDAQYTFEIHGGAWYLTKVDVFTSLEAGRPVPPLPCGSGGHRPNNSFKPTPLRGAA